MDEDPIMPTEEWTVVLRTHSAVRFKEDEKIRIEASAASTAPVHLVALHNDYIGPPEDGLSHRGLRFDVSGRPASLEEAASILGGIGAAYANVLSVVGNAFVGEPRLSVVYRLPSEGRKGEFFQRTQVNEPTSPPAVVRTLPLKETGEFVNVLDSHAEKERLFRSCAHYAEALRHWHEFEALAAAESLFIAAETLGPIILRRLLAEEGISKEGLAKKFGFAPDPTGGTKHLYALDAHLLRIHVFDGDDDCFKALKNVSHGFEHGFADFGKIRSDAEAVREKAAKYIRRSIFRETRLGDDAASILNSKPFDEVQGGWDPYIEMQGDLEALDPADLPADFIGLKTTAYVESITETGDDHREISVKLSGDGSTISEGLRVTPRETKVWMPGTKYSKLGDSKSVLEVTRKDGSKESEEGTSE